jgi:hypothetical protein
MDLNAKEYRDKRNAHDRRDHQQRIQNEHERTKMKYKQQHGQEVRGISRVQDHLAYTQRKNFLNMQAHLGRL